MARFRVLVRSLIGGALRQPGEEIDLPDGMAAGENLKPLDAAAEALRAEHIAYHRATVPAGSPTAHEVAGAMSRGYDPRTET